MTESSVSAIIPTFNGHRLLEKHLPAVIKSLHDQDELLIIDDASSDETTNWLRNGFALTVSSRPAFRDDHGDFVHYQGFFGSKEKKIAVTVIKNERNLRFALTVNRAARLAARPLLFLLNNDVSPHPLAREKLARHFHSAEAEDLFAVAPLEYETESKQTLNQAKKSGRNQLFFERGLFQHRRHPDLSAGETAWVSGGSGLFSREKFLALQGFDSHFYPAYWEDLELAHRARQQGWRLWFDPEAIVFHQHESTHRAVFSARTIESLSWRHAHYFTRKHARGWQKWQAYFWRPYWWLQERRTSS